MVNVLLESDKFCWEGRRQSCWLVWRPVCYQQLYSDGDMGICVLRQCRCCSFSSGKPRPSVVLSAFTGPTGYGFINLNNYISASKPCMCVEHGWTQPAQAGGSRIFASPITVPLMEEYLSAPFLFSFVLYISLWSVKTRLEISLSLMWWNQKNKVNYLFHFPVI